MKTRIDKIISYYNLSASKFAEVINIQRSSISHILSGRNKPSLEVVQKILENFNDINTEWLLTGKGEMIKSNTPTLPFEIEEKIISENISDNYQETKPSSETKPENLEMISKLSNNKKIDRIIVFYTDKSFDEYNNNN